MDNESLPNVVLISSVSLIILAIGIFAFYTVYNEIGYSTEQIDVFGVTDPSNNVTVTLDYIPASVTLVEQYNGYEWKIIPPEGYSNSGYHLTVDSDYLEG